MNEIPLNKFCAALPQSGKQIACDRNNEQNEGHLVSSTWISC
jgi:hypothetical protein